jgi:hypothetical protein
MFSYLIEPNIKISKKRVTFTFEESMIHEHLALFTHKVSNSDKQAKDIFLKTIHTIDKLRGVYR